MNLLQNMTRTKLIVLFLALLLGLGFIPVFIAGAFFPGDRGAGAAAATFRSLAPLLAALLIQGPLLRQPVLEPLAITIRPSRAVLLAWLTPLFALIVGLVLTHLIFGANLILSEEQLIEAKRSRLSGESLERFEAAVRRGEISNPLSLITMGLTGGMLVNLFPLLAEEIGFRGFLFRELPGDFWRRSFLIGLIAGIFSLPTAFLLNLFPAHPLEGAALLFIFTVLSSPLLVYLRILTNSTIAVAITRAGFVAFFKVGADLAPDAHELVAPPFGIAGILGLVAILLLYMAYDSWRNQPPIFKARARRSASP